MKTPEFYLLNENFETVSKPENYKSIMWVDKYDEPGEVELYLPATMEVLQQYKRDYYLWSSVSDRLMILESYEVNTDREDFPLLIMRGRSLESIIERRILLWDLVFGLNSSNIEDGIRQLLDVSLMSHADEERIIPNFIFEYSDDPKVYEAEAKYEFARGDNLRSVIEKIVKNAKLGYKITLNSNNQFVFKLYSGVDRSFDQDDNTWVIFSQEMNNLKTSNYSSTAGEQYKNLIYTRGEETEQKEIEVVTTGTATGLLRRELFNDQSSISHKVDDVEIPAEEYTELLKQSGADEFEKNKIEEAAECQVDYNVNFEYGKDYGIGDIVQVKNEFDMGLPMRVTEFITSISDSGVELYPTFRSTTEEEIIE